MPVWDAIKDIGMSILDHFIGTSNTYSGAVSNSQQRKIYKEILEELGRICRSYGVDYTEHIVYKDHEALDKWKEHCIERVRTNIKDPLLTKLEIRDIIKRYSWYHKHLKIATKEVTVDRDTYIKYKERVRENSRVYRYYTSGYSLVNTDYYDRLVISRDGYIVADYIIITNVELVGQNGGTKKWAIPSEHTPEDLSAWYHPDGADTF